jgi:hypothetical protein
VSYTGAPDVVLEILQLLSRRGPRSLESLKLQIPNGIAIILIFMDSLLKTCGSLIPSIPPRNTLRLDVLHATLSASKIFGPEI